MQTDVDEQPGAPGPQGAWRDAPSPRRRQHPVRDLAHALGQVQSAQAHAGEQPLVVAHRPASAGLGCPPLRPGRDPLFGFIVTHGAYVPLLDSRVLVDPHDSRRVDGPPRPQNQLVDEQLRLNLVAQPPGGHNRGDEVRHDDHFARCAVSCPVAERPAAHDGPAGGEQPVDAWRS